MKMKRRARDPIATLRKAIQVTERTATTLSVMLLIGTAGYLTVHAFIAPRF